jgi:hypothetical protein
VHERLTVTAAPPPALRSQEQYIAKILAGDGDFSDCD